MIYSAGCMYTRGRTGYMEKERRIALRANSTVIGSPLHVEALVGWKELQSRKGHRMCCFFSYLTSPKNLTRNFWLYPLASWEDCRKDQSPPKTDTQPLGSRIGVPPVLHEQSLFFFQCSWVPGNCVPQWTQWPIVYIVEAEGSGVRLKLHHTLCFPYIPKMLGEPFPWLRYLSSSNDQTPWDKSSWTAWHFDWGGGVSIAFVLVEKQDESRETAALSLSWLPAPSGPTQASNTSFSSLDKSEEWASTQGTIAEAVRCKALAAYVRSWIPREVYFRVHKISYSDTSELLLSKISSSESNSSDILFSLLSP